MATVLIDLSDHGPVPRSATRLRRAGVAAIAVPVALLAATLLPAVAAFGLIARAAWPGGGLLGVIGAVTAGLPFVVVGASLMRRNPYETLRWGVLVAAVRCLPASLLALIIAVIAIRV